MRRKNEEKIKHIDLHEEFVDALYAKEPKRANLVNRIADILNIEKESSYRRLTGKVHFSIREMGLIASTLNISIDSLLHKDAHLQWIPFILKYPMQISSIDSLCNTIEANMKRLAEISAEPSESGCVYHSLPLAFFMYHPLLEKFMIFKWGYYFVGTAEFDHFSDWMLPQQLRSMREMIEKSCHFTETFHVWDNTIIWTLAKEIKYFHRIHVITDEEKDALRRELQDLLNNLEQFLQGSLVPEIPLSHEMEFYASSISIGFTCEYYGTATKKHMVMFQTHYSYGLIENDYDSYLRIKNWLKSMQNEAVLLSGSGRSERKRFFEVQYQIIEALLN